MTLEIHRARGHVPMRVVALMNEPIGYLDDLLHLDAFLAAAARHDLDERTRRTIEPIEVTAWPVDFGLPLSTWSVEDPGDVDDRLLKSHKQLVKGTPDRARANERRLWGWCASAADDAAWSRRGKIEIRKKPPLAEMVRYTKDKTANVASGPLKAYDLAIPTVLAAEVTWFALGDIDAVRRLLVEYIPAVGKKRGIGMGDVREWIVEPCGDDRSVLKADGSPARRLPHGAAPGAPGQGAIRPPYWHHTRLVPSVEP